MRSTPRRSPERRSTRRKRDVLSRFNTLAVGMQHRKPGATKARKHMADRLKRHARHDVAARAGIQRAHTSQSPLTRRYVHDARTKRTPFVATQCFQASLATNSNQNAQACPVWHDRDRDRVTSRQTNSSLSQRFAIETARLVVDVPSSDMHRPHARSRVGNKPAIGAMTHTTRHTICTGSSSEQLTPRPCPPPPTPDLPTIYARNSMRATPSSRPREH